MSAFDFERFNGFMRQGLDDLLFEDIWNYDVFNESDLHSAAYYYIRDYFRRNERRTMYVRCEPRLGGRKPDIVVYSGARPTYAIEFKFSPKQDIVDEEGIFKDLDKLADIGERFDTIRWGFFFLVHDGEETYRLSDATLRRRDYKKISASTINVRKKKGSDRRRRGYERWRMEFDRLQKRHREHAH